MEYLVIIIYLLNNTPFNTFVYVIVVSCVYLFYILTLSICQSYLYGYNNNWAISEECFTRLVYPTICTKVAIKQQHQYF